MSTTPSEDSENKPPRIRRGRVESVDLYEIKDSELDIFQRGSPADLQFNFAIFLLSIAFSAIASLAAATFANQSVHTTFIVVAVVGTLLGAYFLISWWRNRKSLTRVCATIRERIKETTEIVVMKPKAGGTILAAAVEPKEPPKPKD